MNKSELIENVQKSLGGDTSKAQAERAVDAVIAAIKSSVKQAGKSVKIKDGPPAAVALQLVGFGTFSVARRNGRSGVNPATGAKIKIKAAKVVKFKAGAGLKALV